MPRKKLAAKKTVKAKSVSPLKARGKKGHTTPAKRRAGRRAHETGEPVSKAPIELESIIEAAPTTLPSSKSFQEINITVQTKEGTAFTLNTSKLFQRAAMQWTYVLRNRRRWATQESVRDEQSRRSRKLFEEFGVATNELKMLAESEVVEVSIPFQSEALGWEARIFPWEYMLTAATREYRGGRAMIVVRHLDRAGGSAPRRTPDLKKVLYVESAPSALKDIFSFDSERALVKTNLNLNQHHELMAPPPTVEMLRREVAAFAPDVIHLAGADNHQAARMLDASSLPVELDDGYVMAGEQSALDFVGAERLASVLNAAGHRPTLVCFNLFNTGARVSPLVVAGGTDTAIGFQDEFEDAQTEFFFTSFYHTWKLSGWNTLEAFRVTCNALRMQGGLYGTGVVLWSAHTLVGQQASATTARRRGKHTGAALPVEAAELERRVRTEKEKDVVPESVDPGKASEVLQVKVKPYDSLNYSMLHNNRPLFDTFLISKPGPGRVRGIKVKVVLYAGSTSFPYDLTLDMEQSPLDLRDLIRVPLIYSMGPAISESVHTSLYINVTWGAHELYSNTHRVTLLPLDEWRDDDNDRVWLPSFVLPRDRTVNRIIDAGQRYLWALADDSGAGFDGYQSVIEEEESLVKETLLNTDGVDLQVQALWAALSFEMNLGYINPPPSYNLSSQRVRTPTEVIEGHRGTCIDLALLMATCCEYIEVYPVIFLLEGHAFPGYWRSDLYHQAFIEMANSSPGTNDGGQPGSQPQAPSGAAQRFPWYLDRNFYGEVLQQVRDLKLVPIESTMISRRGSFREAVDAGIENLRSKKQFHSLIDVRLARDNRVTPIPLRGRSE
jgi:hypothetical protein